MHSPGWMNRCRHCFLFVFLGVFLDLFAPHLCFILWPCIASSEKKKKRQKRNSRWYVLHSVGAVDVNVCTLYSTFINTCRALSLGDDIEVYEIVPLFFYVKKYQ